MDRRKRKTREAIFAAFTGLLSEKDFGSITVGEVIDRADVGRATFYSHFETKDYLLKSFCEELFCHIFDSAGEGDECHKHIFSCGGEAPVFLHLLRHIGDDDNNIKRLFCSRNNALFLEYFKKNLYTLVDKNYENIVCSECKALPREYYVNHVAATFVETVRWWLCDGKNRKSQEVYEYFKTAVHIKE